MDSGTKNIILGHLRHIRTGVEQLGAEFEAIKRRLMSLEERMTLVARSVANLHGDITIVHARLDRLDARVERIEKRLELTSV